MSNAGMQARHDKYLRDMGTVGARCGYCGKVQYTTRSAAKKATKRYPADKFSVYRCVDGGDFWHIGHQSTRITFGYESRLERYGA